MSLHSLEKHYSVVKTSPFSRLFKHSPKGEGGEQSLAVVFSGFAAQNHRRIAAPPPQFLGRGLGGGAIYDAKAGLDEHNP